MMLSLEQKGRSIPFCSRLFIMNSERSVLYRMVVLYLPCRHHELDVHQDIVGECCRVSFDFHT